MFGNQDREKGWRSPARAGKSNTSPTSTAMRQPKPHPPGNHGPSQRRVPLPQLVRAHASYAIPASQLSRGRRRARGHLPCTCQQGRGSQTVTSRAAQAEQAQQQNQARALPFAMPAAVNGYACGLGPGGRADRAIRWASHLSAP